MTPLPTIRLGDYDITRLIVGGNPLCANSHFSEAMSREMLGYYTPEQVVSVLQRCQQAGINTIQARADYHRILYWLELFRRQGGKLHWIAQTASEMADVFGNIRVTAAAGAIAIYHHGTQTDRFWHEGRIGDALDYLKRMRDSGVLVGLGTHIPEVVEYAEERSWDVDFYMTCLYNLSRKPRQSNLVNGTLATQEELFLDEDREAMCRVIRATPKPCLAFKILAANRKCGSQEEVAAAFRYAIANIKPTDAVVVGMYPKHIDQVALNVQHTLAAVGWESAR
jgi:hypothetical protein